MQWAVSEYLPTRDTAMIKLMELLAVSEASRRSMLPKRYRDMALADIQSHLIQARRRALVR